jgi:hypothetical protein
MMISEDSHRDPEGVTFGCMTPSSLLALLVGNAKLATAVAATAAVTASGGIAVASAVTPDNPHAAAGLARAAEAHAAAPAAAPTADEVDLPPCPGDVKNHGAYVSSVAKTKPAEGDAPNAHGKLVSAAAQSDCGKPEGAGADADEKSSNKQDNANERAGNARAGKPATTGQAASHVPAAVQLPTG